MRPPIEYRQPRPASSSGRTPEFGSGKAGSNPAAGTNQETSTSQRVVIKALEPVTIATKVWEPAEQILARRRAAKAASMRKWRAKQKGKTE